MSTYRVQRGDTLERIARRKHVSLEQLRQANPSIHDPRRLRVGAKLNIPGSRDEFVHPPQRRAGMPQLGATASSGSSGTSSIGAPANLGPGTNAQKAFQYFVQKGLTPQQAAGIVGNLMQESGMDPNSVQQGGPGRGIAQWSVGERWNNVLKLAQQEGKSPNDLGVQLDAIWQELNGPEKGSLTALKQANSVEDATRVFCTDFERAGIPNMQNRINQAIAALQQAHA